MCIISVVVYYYVFILNIYVSVLTLLSQASYFGAHKFCRARGLTLGTADVKSKETEIISLVRPSGTDAKFKIITPLLMTNKNPANDKGKLYWGEYRIVNATYMKEKKAICTGFSM